MSHALLTLPTDFLSLFLNIFFNFGSLIELFSVFSLRIIIEIIIFSNWDSLSMAHFLWRTWIRKHSYWAPPVSPPFTFVSHTRSSGPLDPWLVKVWKSEVLCTLIFSSSCLSLCVCERERGEGKSKACELTHVRPTSAVPAQGCNTAAKLEHPTLSAHTFPHVSPFVLQEWILGTWHYKYLIVVPHLIKMAKRFSVQTALQLLLEETEGFDGDAEEKV